MKLRKITFENDPILGNLHLDFLNGESPASTIYIAGENGTGKTSILNSIFRLSNIQVSQIDDGSTTTYSLLLSDEEAQSFKSNPIFKAKKIEEIENVISIKLTNSGNIDWNRVKIEVISNGNIIPLPGHILMEPEIKKIFRLLFSDSAIDFSPSHINSVTSKNIDEITTSQKTNRNLATEITQLLIDIQALDDADISRWARANRGTAIDESILDQRISRFREAFSMMFPSKKYKEIRNENGIKKVIFSDHGKECHIGDLSSGEKQIVFRGGFFLKDSAATPGIIGIIDEPEISLHPDWQLKIMNFYKSVLGINSTSSESQIIAATHSPFILNNYDKSSEKILVLSRNNNGEIKTQEQPYFYGWTHENAIKKAFKINIDSSNKSPLILVEGETDEIYLREAIRKSGVNLSGAEVHWVGKIGDRGDAEFTGDKALNHTLAFAKSNPIAIGRPLVLLYDCDTKKPESDHDRVSVRAMPFIANNNIKKGIENLIKIPKKIDINQFTFEASKIDDYSIKSTIRQLDKRKLCTHLVSQSQQGEGEEIFDNFRELLEDLKITIERLINLSPP